LLKKLIVQFTMKLAFIQTGGTIDKDYPRTHAGYAFEIGEPAVSRILQKLNPTFQYEIFSAMKKDSQEINTQDRQHLLDMCQEIDYERIIITHGTDTLLETAEYLSVLKSKTIVLTGAMRPELFSNSDAPIHIGMAISAVQCLPAGVYVAMQGLILPWNQVKRDENTWQFVPK
jgi:L-asparaginase